MGRLIDGRAIANARQEAMARDVERFAKLHGRPPGLAVVLVGNDPASDIYVGRKTKVSRTIGIRSTEHRLAETTSEQELLELISALNSDPAIDGILVQLPLPGQINADAVLDAIAPAKDVDGFHPVNMGRISASAQGLVPCTPLGCMHLLDTVIENYVGLKAVVIGKSNIVGKPVALLLLEGECTVTVTHIHTRGLPDIVRTADIVVVAAGSPGLVRGDWVKPGAVVIDVGINRIVDAAGKRQIVGDACRDEMDHVLAISPVPGGVGPMTIASLLENTLKAAWRNSQEAPAREPGSIEHRATRSVSVSVDDLAIDALIGVNADEHDRRQSVRLFVQALINPPADDTIGSTLDYRRIVALAQSVSKRHTGLIETFATELATLCLAETHVSAVEVRIAKPSALANGLAGAVVRVEAR